MHRYERLRRRREASRLRYRPTVKRVYGKHTRGMYTTVYTHREAYRGCYTYKQGPGRHIEGCYTLRYTLGTPLG